MASAYQIQQRAIASLKTEFENAIYTAKGKIFSAVDAALMVEDIEAVRDVMGFKYPDFTHNLGYARDYVQFLVKGAEGTYLPQDRYLNVGADNKLWGDYLISIKRHANGFGSIPANRNTIQELIDQNGPKKMEKRLAAFLKKRIDYTSAHAAYGIAPKTLDI